jgi:hypothetical protein
MLPGFIQVLKINQFCDTFVQKFLSFSTGTRPTFLIPPVLRQEFVSLRSKPLCDGILLRHDSTVRAKLGKKGIKSDSLGKLLLQRSHLEIITNFRTSDFNKFEFPTILKS